MADRLVVSSRNPRYFTNASGRAVYLTGSHVWNNLHDGLGLGPACAEVPEPFDFDAYLRFLKERNHNFIRLWRWEQFRSRTAGDKAHLCAAPQPWPRTGPGAAKDGRAKFDLSQFDAAFFDRLRARVDAAGRQGIYVAVMLFEGWGLHLSPAPDHVEGHPFHAANNINGIGIASINDVQVLPLDERIERLQQAYIENVIDTLHDLPNVLYEVANESCGGGTVDPKFARMLGLVDAPDWGDSTPWQFWVIDVVKRYEEQQGYDLHPIGMTMQFPVADQTKVNDPLFRSNATWISPGYDDDIFADGRQHPMAPGSPPSRWYADPPASDGRKVILSDTDHYAPGKGGALWAWKSFLRGHHPILMDFGLLGGMSAPDPKFEATRYAMGDTRRYAERMNLIEMQPRDDLASTRFALANPGREVLVLQPDDGSFRVTLEAGAYEVEWYSVDTRETQRGDDLTSHNGETTLRAPFAGPCVVYLRAR